MEIVFNVKINDLLVHYQHENFKEIEIRFEVYLSGVVLYMCDKIKRIMREMRKDEDLDSNVYHLVLVQDEKINLVSNGDYLVQGIVSILDVMEGTIEGSSVMYPYVNA